MTVALDKYLIKGENEVQAKIWIEQQDAILTENWNGMDDYLDKFVVVLNMAQNIFNVDITE